VALPGSSHVRDFAERFGCAQLVDLAVMPEHRRRGIGRELVFEAERVTRANGVGRLGFSTGLGEGYAAARELYRFLGYEEVPGTLHIDSALIATDDGSRRVWMEILTYWLKRL